MPCPHILDVTEETYLHPTPYPLLSTAIHHTDVVDLTGEDSDNAASSDDEDNDMMIVSDSPPISASTPRDYHPRRKTGNPAYAEKMSSARGRLVFHSPPYTQDCVFDERLECELFGSGDDSDDEDDVEHDNMATSERDSDTTGSSGCSGSVLGKRKHCDENVRGNNDDDDCGSLSSAIIPINSGQSTLTIIVRTYQRDLSASFDILGAIQLTTPN